MSTELDIIIKATLKLQLSVQDHLVPLGGALLAEHLISRDNYAFLRNEHLPKRSRAAELVDLVTTKVQQNPENYYTFVRILSKDKSLYADVYIGGFASLAAESIR